MFKGAIRIATERDAEAIAAIYGAIVRDTTISFEVEPPPSQEMAKRIAKTLETHPWVVAERQGQVIGYASFGVVEGGGKYIGLAVKPGLRI